MQQKTRLCEFCSERLVHYFADHQQWQAQPVPN